MAGVLADSLPVLACPRHAATSSAGCTQRRLATTAGAAAAATAMAAAAAASCPAAWSGPLTGGGAGASAVAKNVRQQLRGSASSSSAASSVSGDAAAGTAEALAGAAALASLVGSLAARRGMRRVVPARQQGGVLPQRRWEVAATSLRVAVGSKVPEGEAPADEEELRDVAGQTLGSNFSLRDSSWPPKQSQKNDTLYSQQRDRLEGFRGGNAGARAVPPLEHWPYYEVSLADLPVLDEEGVEEMEEYRPLDLSKDLQRAFALVDNWRQFNTGRSLHFTQKGAAKLSGAVETLPMFARQLQGMAVFEQWKDANEASNDEADFERFLASSGADDITANELRSVVRGIRHGAKPEDIFALSEGSSAPLDELRVEAMIGMEKGNALAIWAVETGPEPVARVEFCFGHDCVENGPLAEEMLLRFIGKKAAEEGVTKLKCRVRFTEDGLFLVPPAFVNLGLTRRPEELWEAGMEQDEEVEVDRELALRQEGEEMLSAVEAIPEVVPGLKVWLTVQGLEAHIEAANSWCEEMGAATLAEVVESREDLIECFGDALTEEQRQRLAERQY